MEQSPSWEANRFFSYSRNSPHFMGPEGSLPQSQVPATCPYPEPARSNPYPHFLKIYLNIILPSTPGSPKCPLFFRFPHQNPVYASPLPPTRYMPRPSHSSLFYHPNNIGWGVMILYSFIYTKSSWKRNKLVGLLTLAMILSLFPS